MRQSEATPCERRGRWFENLGVGPKQVWHPKPNHLRNTLDTLPFISSDPLPRAPQPQPPKNLKTHKQTPPRERWDFTVTIFEREGHLATFCFRRKRDERQVSKSSRKNMNHPSHGVHAQPVQRRRPRGALPLATRP